MIKILKHQEAELAKLKLAYTFASFWIGDNAVQARSDQMYTNGESIKTAMNDSVPVVTDAFKRQMVYEIIMRC